MLFFLASKIEISILKEYFMIFLTNFLIVLSMFIENETDRSIYYKEMMIILIILFLFGLIIFIMNKMMKSIHQTCIVIIYIILIIINDILIMRNCEPKECIYYLLYLTVFYFLIFEKIKRILSIITFISFIIYFSCKNIVIQNPNILISNFLIILLIVYFYVSEKKNIISEKKEKKENIKSLQKNTYENLATINVKYCEKIDEKIEFFLNFGILGGVLIFKRIKKIQQSQMKSEQIEMIFSNKKCKETYLISSIKDFIKFITEIDIDNTEQIHTKNNILKFLNINNNDETVNSLEDENMTHINESFKKQNNLYFRLKLSKYSLKDEEYFYVYFEEIENLNEIKLLKEQDEKKSKILVSVTHDLRSPLNGILAFLNSAKSEYDSIERNKLLDFSIINANLLMVFINDILDFHSMSQNKVSLNLEEFSLNQLIDDVYQLMKIQAYSKNIALIIKNECKDLDLQLFSDQRRLKQILLNLLGNSLKFTVKGYVKLKISMINIKKMLKFEVIDTGIGMKQEIIDQLGKPYATFDTANGLNKYGVGFGLHISQNFIGLLGPRNNKLYVSSMEGKGSKFGFLIYIHLKNNVDQLTLSLKRLFAFNSDNTFTKSKYYKTIDQNSKPTFLQQKSEQILKFSFENENKRKSILQSFQKINTGDYLSRIPLKTKTLIDPSPRSQKSPKSLSLMINNNNVNFKHERKSGFQTIIENEFSPFESEESLESILGSNKTFIELSKDDDDIIQGDYINLFFQEHVFVDSIRKNDLNSRSNSCKTPHEQKNKVKVLIVDDNPFNILVLVKYLQKIDQLDIKHESAMNGVECVEKFKISNKIQNDNNYNIIFMDCLMPLQDGYITSRIIKELIEKESYIKVMIIAVTGLEGIDEQIKCKENGMDDFITKPVNEQEFKEILFFYSTNINLVQI